MIQIAKSIAEYRAWFVKQKAPVVSVFTMGALHQGHAELIKVAKNYVVTELAGYGKVVVSIFVNPTQFNSAADLANYPKTFEQDLALATEAGADLIFAPTAQDMYPSGETLITLQHHEIGEDLEGASRPGHFTGMLTVVNKLLNITSPVATFFGEKDFQQLALVRQMVTDLNMPIQVVGVPTVRDHDGLALSSRNSRLSESARELASQIPATLSLISHSISEGHDLVSARKIALDYLQNFAGIKLDYLELRNQNLQQPTEQDSVRALIAVEIDGVRLIDNMTVKD